MAVFSRLSGDGGEAFCSVRNILWVAKTHDCFHVPEERIVPFLQILLLTMPHKKAQIVPPERKCKPHCFGYPQNVPLEQIKIFHSFVFEILPHCLYS